MQAGKLDSFRSKLIKASILILGEFGYVPYDRAGHRTECGFIQFSKFFTPKSSHARIS